MAAWTFARHWEFWLALVVGAFLRFWHLDLSSFLVDQNIYLRLARAAVTGHMLPVTGVAYSVGGYSPPFGQYLMMPFALVTHDPFPVIVSIAVWNVLGVALCYVFALRYFGRWVAGVGTLIFATCGVAVNYSRFVWQPNYEATFLILWALALFAWCIDGRRRWFGASVILLVLLLEINPVTAILIPIMVVAWLMAPRRPRVRGYAVAGGVVLIVLAPTLLWEIVTQGLDFRLLSHAFGHHATISLTVLRVLLQTVGGSGPGDLGPESLYARFGTAYTLVNLLAALFFAAGWLILSWRVFAPVVRTWRATPLAGVGWRRFAGKMAATWRTLRADRSWRVNVLLWLWVTLPPLSMVRHSSPPTVHYLIVMYPALFLVSALPVQFLRDQDVLGWLAGRPLSAPLDRRVVAACGVAVAALLIAGQAAQSALYPASLVSPGFEALRAYGFPLAEMQAAERSISDLQRQQGIASVYISLPADNRYRWGMDYLLVGEHGDRIGYADNCLVLPPPAAPPTLLVSTSADGPTSSLLPALANAQRVASIPMVGGAPFQVYRVSGAVPALPGEKVLAPATYQAAPHDALRLDAAALVAPELLRLRWTVLEAASDESAPEVYHIAARSADGGTATALGAVDCQPTRWQAGQTVFTWLSLAPAKAPAGTAPAVPGSVAVGVSTSAPHLYTPVVGPLHLLSARYLDDTPIPVQPVPSSSSAGVGAVGPSGTYVVPISALATG